MLLQVDPKSALPLYAQLADQIRQAVGRGELSPGVQLPTVRQMAVDLAINPNTVAKAYSELERGGLIVTRQGSGTYVREGSASPAPEERQRRLAEIMDAALGQAAAVGCSAEEFSSALQAHVLRPAGAEGSR
jgi:GntR family transcriptional regulator